MTEIEIYYDALIGKGACSNVYLGTYKKKLANNKYDSKYIAVKIIDTDGLKKKTLDQYKREIDIIRILRKNPHKNIPEYYKIKHDTDAGRIIIAMEWCKRGNLKSEIKKGLSMLEIQRIYSQIIDGYNHLLSLNIIHRDMKGDNITLTEDGTVKIIDYGLSKIISTDMTSTFVGSPAYMSPERINEEEYGRDSDIWSLGVILHEMIYYTIPFRNCKNIKQLKKRAKNGESIYLSPERIEKVNGKNIAVPIDPLLIEYLEGCLNINYFERYKWEDMIILNWVDESQFINIEYNDNEEYKEIIQSIAHIKDINSDNSDNSDNKDKEIESDESDSDSNSNYNSNYYDTPMFEMDGINDNDNNINNNNIDNNIDNTIRNEINYYGNDNNLNSRSNIISQSPKICYIKRENDNNRNINIDDADRLLDSIMNDDFDPNFISKYDFINKSPKTLASTIKEYYDDLGTNNDVVKQTVKQTKKTVTSTVMFCYDKVKEFNIL